VHLIFSLWLVFYSAKAAQEVSTDLWQTEGEGIGKGLCP